MKCQSNLHYSGRNFTYDFDTGRGFWLVVEMNTKLFLGKFRRPIPVTSYKPSVGLLKLYNKGNFTHSGNLIKIFNFLPFYNLENVKKAESLKLT